MSNKVERVIIASDIFGQTDALKSFAAELHNSLDVSVDVIDPYGGAKLSFVDESEAYQYFSEYSGMVKYTDVIRNQLNESSMHVKLIGFSAGASGVWQVLADSNLNHVKGAYCFYGSQIRNSINLNPLCSAILHFPEYESHFDVNELIQKLKTKKNVTINQSSYLHGFMNPYSNHYNELGYKHGLTSVLAWLKQ